MNLMTGLLLLGSPRFYPPPLTRSRTFRTFHMLNLPRLKRAVLMPHPGVLVKQTPSQTGQITIEPERSLPVGANRYQFKMDHPKS